jgi:hypothetical protein
MNQALIRLVAILGLVGIGSLCFHHFACTRGDGPHLLPPAVGDYLDGVVLSSDLQPRVESNHRRIQAKYVVVTELLAGRVTLRAAAARFAELDADVPDVRERLAQRYPGAPAEVAWCREVIEHARSVLRARAAKQVESLVIRLEAELRAIREAEADVRQP